ncbi:hypothetical protein BB561_001732 [Smittium simulii]|uniref:glycerophosphodiester phosphodiesterase n=1 Tax=Smittium simulii TaxID=133385 RepID=A0A2T9YTE6_9FUNG|nr:hypothetical protein BB561_001732 [Smittium simulii]
MLKTIFNIYAFALFANFAYSRCGWNTIDGNPPSLVGHKGEKAFMPEHTLGSYHMAALEAVDYIETDISISKDGVLVIVHNGWLGQTTNVAELPQFADRKKQYIFNGKYAKINRTEWFVWDFTYAELKTINRIQDTDYAYRPQYFNNDFYILTFDEYLDHIENLSKNLDRQLGVALELKFSEVFNSLFPSDNGRGYEDKVLEVLSKRNYNINQPPPSNPVINNGDLLDHILNIKPSNYTKSSYKPVSFLSFDHETCEYLGKKTKIPVISLNLNSPWMYTPKGLDKIASYSKILSPEKNILLAGPELYFEFNEISYNKTEIESMGGFLEPKELIRESHKRGIELSPFTLYDSRQPSGLLCTRFNDTRFKYCPKNRKEEMFYYFELGCSYITVENIFEAQILRLAFDSKIASKDC